MSAGLQVVFAGAIAVFAGPRVEGTGPHCEGVGPHCEGVGPIAVGAGPIVVGAGPIVVGSGSGATLVAYNGPLSPWESLAVEDADVNLPIALHKALTKQVATKSQGDLKARVTSSTH